MLWEAVHRRLASEGSEPCLQEAGQERPYTAWQLMQMVYDLSPLLSHHASSRGHPSGQPPIVALFLTPSAGYVASVLAVLQLRCAYLPLDPRWPPQRLQQVVQHARPVAVVWASEAAGGHGPPPVGGCPLVRLPDQLLQERPEGAASPQPRARRKLTSPLGRQLLPTPVLPPPLAAARVAPQQQQQQQPSPRQPHQSPLAAVRSSAAGSAAAPPPLPLRDDLLMCDESEGGSEEEEAGGRREAVQGVDDEEECLGDPYADAAEELEEEQGYEEEEEEDEGEYQAPAPQHLLPFCYVLYTSGSTGAPLAVCGTEEGLLNRCQWMQTAHPLARGDRAALRTPPCFVDAAWELFGPLLAGAVLVVVPHATATNPQQLLELVAQRRVTHLSAVPTLWRALLGCLDRQPDLAARLALCTAVSSGEALPAELAGGMQRLLPAGCKLLNLYGCTEVAADCTAFEFSSWQPPPEQPRRRSGRAAAPEPAAAWADGAVAAGGTAAAAVAAVPAGLPISNTLVAVLHPEHPLLAGSSSPAAGGGRRGGSPATAAAQPLCAARGQQGEVVVAGCGLAAGYLRAGRAQQQRFLELPSRLLCLARQQGGALEVSPGLPPSFLGCDYIPCFRTGDWGYMDAAGCLHLCGRRDLQVKVQGVRVDLAEVEAALAAHPAVTAAAARVWALPAGELLVAYAELEPPSSSSSSREGGEGGQLGSALQAWCRQQLPSAAVPAQVQLLARLPRSAAGKVQRSQLPAPATAAAAAAAAAATAAAAPMPGSSAEPKPPPAKRPRQQRQQQLKGASSAAAMAAAAAAAAAVAAPASEGVVARAFAAALGHAAFEPSTSLFSAGGSSLTAAQVANELGVEPEMVFQHPSVRSLAAALSTAAAAAATPGQAPAAQQQQGLPPALAVSAPRLAVASRRRQQGPLRMLWRAKLLRCVDAPPALSGDQRHVFACSHGGDVACWDAATGQQLWQATLPDRANAGLVLCPAGDAGSTSNSTNSGGSSGGGGGATLQRQFLAVATNEGCLSFLDAATGAAAGSVQAAGGLRAPPVVDPWHGLVWVGSHGRMLLVAAPPGRAAGQLACPAAVSAAVTFHPEQRLAYVACLDGSLLAVAATESGGSGAESCSLELRVAWQNRCPAPLFAAPMPCGRAVVAAAVDGSVCALDAASGELLWRASVGDAVYVPPLLLPAAAQPLPTRRQQQQAAAQGQVMLLGTAGGALHALCTATGRQLAAASLPARISSMQLLERPAGQQQQTQGVAVCLGPGVVALLDPVAFLHGSTQCITAAVHIPGEVFSQPAASSGGLFVGCRDDFMYCLALC